MRIAFDATALPALAGGAGNYILKLVAGLRKLDSGDRVFVLSKPQDVDRLGPWPSGSGFEPVVVPLGGRVQRLLWEQLGLPGLLRRMNVDVLHSPHYTSPLASSVRRVVTLHDLTFFLYPQHHDLTKVLFFRRMIRWSSRAAAHVITDSAATKSDAMRLLGLASEHMTTVPLAADERFRPIEREEARAALRSRHAIDRPFLLTVCTLEPRKNLVGAIRALRIVREQRGDVGLVVAGAHGWRVAPIFEEVARQGLDGEVRFLGHVPEDDLALLYSACELFLYPSLYEGFGLPPLEAMACGSAVVVSDRSSMPEVVGDAGLLCDPERPEDIAAKALALLQDPPSAQLYRGRALARAAQFSWLRTAQQTRDVYERVCAASPRSSPAPGEQGREDSPLLSAPISGTLVARRALHGALLHGLLKLRGLLLLPVLARALGPAGLGVVTLAGALGGMLAPILTLGVPVGASLLLPGLRERGALARAFSTTARFSLLAAGVGSALVLAGLQVPALRPAALDALAPHALPFVLWLFVSSLRELALLAPSLRQETGYLVRSNMLADYGGAGLAIAATLAGAGPGAVLLAFAAGLALGLVPALIRSWSTCGFEPGLDGASLRAALGNGLPFLVIGFGQWALQSLDSLFLASLHGAAAVGVYGVSYSIASGVLLVLAVVNFVFFPTAVSLWREGAPAVMAFFELSFRLATLVLGLLLAEACLLGPWLVELLAGGPYREAGRILPLIVLSFATLTYMQLLQYVPMVVTRRSAPAAAVYLPAVVLNLALNVWLIPRFALLGAAIATALSYLAAALLMGRLARRVLPDFACWGPLLRCAPTLALSAAAALGLAAGRDASVARAAGAALLLALGYAALARITGALRPSDWRYLKRSR